MGRVYPHVHAKIVSPDDHLGQPLPVGQPGELCVSRQIARLVDNDTDDDSMLTVRISLHRIDTEPILEFRPLDTS